MNFNNISVEMIISIIILIVSILAIIVPFYREKAPRIIDAYKLKLPDNPSMRGTHDIRGLLRAGIKNVTLSRNIYKIIKTIENETGYHPLGKYKEQIPQRKLKSFFKQLTYIQMPDGHDSSAAIENAIKKIKLH